MNTTTADVPIRYALIEYVTRTAILNVYEALSIERVQFELVKYDPEAQRTLERAACYLLIGKCKLLCHQVLTGQAERPGWKLESFGGSRRDGQVESRTFRAEYDVGERDRFATNPYRLTIAIGPGKANAKGGIQPDGKPTTQVSMRFGADDFVMHCLEIRDFLLVHQHEIEVVRQEQQIAHYLKRQQAQAVPRAIPARLVGAGRS
jgi:hypothetical protein